jgi:hypothetical protein
MFRSSKRKQYYAMSEDCCAHPSVSNSSHLQNAAQFTHVKEIFLPFPCDLMKSQPYCDESIRLLRLPFFRPIHDVYSALFSFCSMVILSLCRCLSIYRTLLEKTFFKTVRR